MPSLHEIRDRLRRRTPTLLEEPYEARAAVAMVLWDGGTDPEVLFIERTRNEQDPWSGHLGFPGGRVDPEDSGPRETAVRETREEIGVDLDGADVLGRLDDLVAANRPVVVSCFVFGVAERPLLFPNPAEVADAFWFPLAKLRDPTRSRKKSFRLQGEEREFPAVRLLEERRPYLWGLTHRIIFQFLEATDPT